MKRLLQIFLSISVLLAAFFFTFRFLPQERSNEQRLRAEQREEGREALEALDFWTRARAYPDADIPTGKYYRAYQVSKMKHKEIARSISSGSIWDPIGPTNLHGRAISVAINPINPNTVYMGSASGGMWRSFSGGLADDWQRIAFGYPVTGVGAILIDPADSNTIYVGTGEVYQFNNATGGLVVRITRGSYGIGILKTTNGGQTWTKSLDWTLDQQGGIERLAINPLNHNTIYAATSYGMYISHDAGANWDYALSSTMITDVVVNTLDTTQLLAAGGNFGVDAGIFRSTDAGIHWVNISPVAFTGKTMLEPYQTNPNWVYASIADDTTGAGSLYRSTDFGAHWTYLSGPGGILGVQGWYSHYVAVHPADSTQVLWASVGASKSTNGGVTFSGGVGGLYSDNHSYAHHPTNPNIVYSVNDDGIYRSTDFGASFTDVNGSMQTGQLYNGFSNSASDSLVALTQSQDHIPGYRYTGAMTWIHGGAASDETGWTATNPADDHYMYAVSRFGQGLYRSTNRGSSFSYVQGFGLQAAWNSPIAVAPSNPSTIYFGTFYVYKSTTGGGGGSFIATNGNNPLDGTPVISLAVAPANANTVIAGTAPGCGIFRTTNGGTNWQNITGAIPARYPLDLAIDPTDNQTYYVALGGFNAQHLMKTTDGGANWFDLTGTLPDVPTTAVAIDPLHANVVYVGNDVGVYVSTDGGASWSEFNDGLPDAVQVSDLTISPSNRSLRVATHGNGAWERKLLFELPPNYFDYRVTQFSSPTDGGTYLENTTIAPIQAIFRNVGVFVPVNPTTVKLRVVKNGIELSSETQSMPPLSSGQSRSVAFSQSFTPMDTGTYIFQAISLASDQNAGNDTAFAALTIVEAPKINKWIVTKGYCPYSDIVGGSPGPSGDDFQKSLALPFPFVYDGYAYDSAQISTNGWIEFGKGAAGSVRGLSTLEQITPYYTASMANTSRPTKIIAPWWADMATGPSGVISYATTGSAPNRVFVVQWKDVLPYFDAGLTTMKINFQIQLFENGNLIEIHYGPVIAGTFPGGATGAAMTLKDYIGGDFRYYDLASGGTGPAGSVIETLTPTVNWPGADSCFHIKTNPDGVSLSLMQGWNMVSLPVLSPVNAVRVLFPFMSSTAAFKFTGSYEVVDTMVSGIGYWIKMPFAEGRFIEGMPIDSMQTSLRAGWNMIGMVAGPVDIDSITSSPPGIVGSQYFDFAATYLPTTTLYPGKAYWVKASSAGFLNLKTTPGASPKLSAGILDRASSITITDKLGRKQTLYLTSDIGKNIPLARYEMPPLPPDGLFDARFASGRMLETYSPTEAAQARFSIQMQSPVYPLMVAYHIKEVDGKIVRLDEQAEGTDKTVRRSHVLQGEGSIMIARGNGESLSITLEEGKTRPTRFALNQNYPNPFNPTTTISFDVPVKTQLSLKVYDILGKEVLTLAEGLFEAGTHSVQATMSQLASGMYLYRLQAGSFTQTKKLILVK